MMANYGESRLARLSDDGVRPLNTMMVDRDDSLNIDEQ